MNLRLLINLSPLVVATLHGYGAAWLAVRMLFRPRQAMYLLGWQLPLTPGLLPKERQRFIESLSTVIAEKLLNIETITDELMKLDLQVEMAGLAQREYMQIAQSEAVLEHVTGHLRERLIELHQSEEKRREITRALRGVIGQEMVNASLLRRLLADYMLDEEALYRVVGSSIQHLAEQVSDSLYVRQAIAQAMAQAPERLLGSGAMMQLSTVSDFIRSLSRKLDFRAILLHRLGALSNDDIEQMVMQTAGREIRAIVWFGAGIGFVVGIFQTLINFF
ncbi:MAG: DUF445 domain-containing protein [Blastocatellia bacterium]